MSQGREQVEWQTATWANGPPFGCTFSEDCVAWTRDALILSFDGRTGKGGEVRTRQFWRYGRFQVDMKPARVGGSVSSFFLYAGQAGTASHSEIDIEFFGGTSFLHTNYWLAGEPYPRDVDLEALGIDPYRESRSYSFVWQPDNISWQVLGDNGRWIEVRRTRVGLATPMQLMMNAWYGDNKESALAFPGYYDGTPGQAEYRAIRILE